MIEIRIVAKKRKIESHYNIAGYTTLNDVALVLLELERMKKTMLEESENYEPIVEIKNKENEDDI